MDNLEGQVETRRSGGLETVLQSLQRAANYSITVRARTAAGAGPASSPIFCTTHEDSKIQKYSFWSTYTHTQTRNRNTYPFWSKDFFWDTNIASNILSQNNTILTIR